MTTGLVSPWLADGHLLHLSSCGLSSVYVPGQVLISSYQDTSHSGPQPSDLILTCLLKMLSADTTF